MKRYEADWNRFKQNAEHSTCPARGWFCWLLRPHLHVTRLSDHMRFPGVPRFELPFFAPHFPEAFSRSMTLIWSFGVFWKYFGISDCHILSHLDYIWNLNRAWTVLEPWSNARLCWSFTSVCWSNARRLRQLWWIVVTVLTAMLWHCGEVWTV